MTAAWAGGTFGERARCVLAPNPDIMTLDGTNTWVLREPGAPRSVVVDPGPEIVEHLDAVAAHAGDVAVVLLTHGHLDHSEAARTFAERVGCGVRALDPAQRLGDEGLGDGDVVAVDGLEVHVVGTPGHTSDSLSFVLPAERAVLTGDTVLGRGTTVVAHPDGQLGAYLDSLHRLHALAEAQEVTAVWPGHGPVIETRSASWTSTSPTGGSGSTRSARRWPGWRKPGARRGPPGRGDGLRRRGPGALGRGGAQRARADRVPAGLSRQLATTRRGNPCTTEGSAGAAGEALDVHDHHGARLEAQPAAGREVGERLVDGLAGGADQLGELLLGEVVVDVHAVVGGPAEPVREVEQRLGDPAGHVGEHQVGDHVVGAAQPAGELGEQAAGDGGTAVEPAQQVLVGQRGERRCR